MASKLVTAYFAGWKLGSDQAPSRGEVSGIPWNDVNCINHAFWALEPADGTSETSFERRASGKPARKKFRIAPMYPEFDLEAKDESMVIPGLRKNHFAQYEYFSKKYPDVCIMISIGGWTRCGYFSEMAHTREGRASFVQRCIELMQDYPWIGGIDIDWEYPGCDRAAAGEDDEGCPVWSTADEDSENFALLIKELRTAMDIAFGAKAKRLTACAAGSSGSVCTGWADAGKWLDCINIMTYDLAGVWDGLTGHSSSLSGTKKIVGYFMDQGIPTEKLCIGTPLYGYTMLMKTVPQGKILGKPVETFRPAGPEISQKEIVEFESGAVSGYELYLEDGRWLSGERFKHHGSGWHFEYDDAEDAAYLYNEDEGSEYYKWFISYENPLSLQAKLDYILKKDLAGIIIWETCHDTARYRLIKQIGDRLLNK